MLFSWILQRMILYPNLLAAAHSNKLDRTLSLLELLHTLCVTQITASMQAQTRRANWCEKGSQKLGLDSFAKIFTVVKTHLFLYSWFLCLITIECLLYSFVYPTLKMLSLLFKILFKSRLILLPQRFVTSRMHGIKSGWNKLAFNDI